MPDMGTVETTPAEVEPTVGAAQQGNTATDYFVGTYRTKEDAEKGLREKELAVNRAFAERDKLKAEFEKLASERQTVQTKPVIDRKALAKEIDERGGEGVIEILERTLSETDSVYEQKLAAISKSYDEKIDTIQRSLQDRDPDYVQYRDKIAELAEDSGLDAVKDRGALLKMAKKFYGSTDGRPPIPGNSATPTMGRASNNATLSEAQLAVLQSSEIIGKLTPAEAAKLAQMTKGGRNTAGRII